jgi:hypothetical protein
MRVRVIMMVLIIDWITNSLYCDTLHYQSLQYTLLLVQNGLQFCDKIELGRLNHVISCEL